MSPNSSASETTSPPSTDSQWRPHAVAADADCWVRDLASDLAVTADYVVPGATKTHKPRILVLYGSLREGSFSRALALECARILDVLGADVRVFTPNGLPPRDPSVEKTDPKVQELRELVQWSEGHVWVSPELHGQITGVFKNQIDWIPAGGEIHPTQGKTTVVLQVNGGSNSFNAVNTMRVLSKWMRMSCSSAQLSVASAWKEFEGGRLKPSGLRSRVVDTIEEFYRFTLAMREQSEAMANRYSERKAKAEAEATAAATTANP